MRHLAAVVIAVSGMLVSGTTAARAQAPQSASGDSQTLIIQRAPTDRPAFA